MALDWDGAQDNKGDQSITARYYSAVLYEDEQRPAQACYTCRDGMHIFAIKTHIYFDYCTKIVLSCRESLMMG
jgi:hypothetical protein